MLSNTRCRVKVFANWEMTEIIEDIPLNLFVRNDAAAKHALLSNDKVLRTDRVRVKVHAAALYGTPYFSFFHDRQVFLKPYLPKLDIDKYLW